MNLLKNNICFSQFMFQQISSGFYEDSLLSLPVLVLTMRNNYFKVLKKKRYIYKLLCSQKVERNSSYLRQTIQTDFLADTRRILDTTCFPTV